MGKHHKVREMAENNILLIQRKEGFCVLILNRPKVMNAINMELIRTLEESFERIKCDESIRVVIIEGINGNFSSGADMSFLSQNREPLECLENNRRLGSPIRTMRELPKPIISKVRGVAVGGGANLALAGDFVLSTNDARFGQIFVNIGLIPDAGGIYFLPRLVGLAKARELALLGEMIDGKTAAALGLIYKSVPDADLDREVESLATTLSLKPLTPVALIKEGLETSFNMSLDATLEWEAAHQAVMQNTREH